MNGVLWMIKFNTHNLRSPLYYFIVLVISKWQQILAILTGYALHQPGVTSGLMHCVYSFD